MHTLISRRLSPASIVLALLALASPGQGQRAIKDINTTPLKQVRVGADPAPARVDPYRESRFLRMGSWVYFRGTTATTGRELFRTNGTKVELVKDIYPGPMGSEPQEMTLIGGKLFFSAGEPLHGRELWVSDGTAKGTRIFADFAPGPESSGSNRFAWGPRWTTPMSKGRILCTLGSTYAKGLGITDGTSAGTRLIATHLGSFVAQGLQATQDGSLAYFAYGAQLWVTDGTTKGTRFLKNIALPARGVSMRPVGAKGMLFQVQGSGFLQELWVSQGTTQTTRRLLTFGRYTEARQQGLRWSANFKGRVWFLGEPGNDTHSLYVTDGTPKGTVAVHTAAVHEILTNLISDGTQLRFIRDLHHQGKSEIWVSDGTAKGTRSWASVPVFSARGPTATGGKVFLSGWTKTAGQELWVTDGTKAGTFMVRDFVAGANGGSPSSITEVAPGQVLLAAFDGSWNYLEAWTSKGTAKTTSKLDFKPWSQVTGTEDDRVHSIVGLSGKVLFSADDGKVGGELWQSDGSPRGTTLLKDIRPGPKSSRIYGYGRLGNQVLFAADDGKSGSELWISDGTSQGTKLLKDIEAGPRSSSPSWFLSTRGRVYFVAGTTSLGRELWVTDGSTAGTRLVKEVMPGRYGLDMPQFAALPDGRILMSHMVSLKPFGTAWWVSDGTSQGTQRILFVPLMPTLFFGQTHLYAYKDRFFFAAADSKNGTELWISDGTAKGTSLFLNIAPDTKKVASSQPSDFFTLGGLLYFQAYDPVHGRALWRSDGTPAGTRYFSPIGVFERASPFPDREGPYTRVGSRHVYFPATDPQSRRTLASLDVQGKIRFFPQINPQGQALPRERWFGEFSYTVADGALWFSAKKTFYDHQLFVLRDHAVASRLGPVMASTTLDSTDPVQGNSARIVAQTKMSQPILMVLLGSPARKALPIPPFYLLYYDLTSFALPIGTGLGSQLQISLPIPTDKSLTGARAMLQAWSLDPLHFPRGLELSNAVHWSLGR